MLQVVAKVALDRRVPAVTQMHAEPLVRQIDLELPQLVIGALQRFEQANQEIGVAEKRAQFVIALEGRVAVGGDDDGADVAEGGLGDGSVGFADAADVEEAVVEADSHTLELSSGLAGDLAVEEENSRRTTGMEARPDQSTLRLVFELGIVVVEEGLDAFEGQSVVVDDVANLGGEVEEAEDFGDFVALEPRQADVFVAVELDDGLHLAGGRVKLDEA